MFASVGPAAAGRPLVVDDVDPVEEGHLQIEAGAAFEERPGGQAVAVPVTFALGVTRWLELGIGLSGVYLDDEAAARRVGGVGDTLVEAKARFPSRLLGLDFGLGAMLKVPTADDERRLGTGTVDGNVTLLVTRSFTDDVRLHLNVG